jgi:hypothetical protein
MRIKFFVFAFLVFRIDGFAQKKITLFADKT